MINYQYSNLLILWAQFSSGDKNVSKLRLTVHFRVQHVLILGLKVKVRGRAGVRHVTDTVKVRVTL